MKAYMIRKMADAAFLGTIVVVVCPLLIFKTWRMHYFEFKKKGLSFVMYSVGILIYKFGVFTVDLFYLARLHVLDDDSKVSKSNIAINILGWHHLLVPTLILLFKSSEDVFQCFSKIDCQAKVSIFQRQGRKP